MKSMPSRWTKAESIAHMSMLCPSDAPSTAAYAVAVIIHHTVTEFPILAVHLWRPWSPLAMRGVNILPIPRQVSPHLSMITRDYSHVLIWCFACCVLFALFVYLFLVYLCLSWCPGCPTRPSWPGPRGGVRGSSAWWAGARACSPRPRSRCWRTHIPSEACTSGEWRFPCQGTGRQYATP